MVDIGRRFLMGIAVCTAVTAGFPLRGGASSGDDGSQVVSLSWFARRNGFTYSNRDNEIRLLSKFHVLMFEGGSRKMWHNGTLVWLNDPVGKTWRRWGVSQRDIDKTILPLLFPDKALKHAHYNTVVIDPGHGGTDSGAIGAEGTQEKRVVLDISRRVAAILKANRINVKMTRTDDSSLSLQERCDIAIELKADVFVSVHANAAANRNAGGLETHIVPPLGSSSTGATKPSERDSVCYKANNHDAASMVLGHKLQRSMTKHLQLIDRGVRRSRFYVTRNMPCPSALVECGFISNEEEEALMNDNAYRQAVAEAIAEAILSYLRDLKRAQLF